MDIFHKNNIKKILKERWIQPSKKLGQNFLIDKTVIRKIIRAADIQTEDTILEIGPGIGTITREIAPRTKQIIAVEKDLKMCEILQETLKDFKNVEIINEDILSFKFQVQPSGQSASRPASFKIIANLPFYAASPIIRKFLESENPPKEMVLIIQKEVAQRICAKPPKMNLLAVLIQFYAKPEIISYVSKKSFWPSPEVDAAIIKITPHRNNKEINKDLFFKIVKAGFSSPRKQLINNLSKKLKRTKEETEKLLLKNNIKPTQRAESLTIEDWIKLVNSF